MSIYIGILFRASFFRFVSIQFGLAAVPSGWATFAQVDFCNASNFCLRWLALEGRDGKSFCAASQRWARDLSVIFCSENSNDFLIFRPNQFDFSAGENCLIVSWWLQVRHGVFRLYACHGHWYSDGDCVMVCCGEPTYIISEWVRGVLRGNRKALTDRENVAINSVNHCAITAQYYRAMRWRNLSRKILSWIDGWRGSRWILRKIL